MGGISFRESLKYCIMSFPVLMIAVLQGNEDVKALGEDVKKFSRRWPMPGFEISELKFKEMDH